MAPNEGQGRYNESRHKYQHVKKASSQTYSLVAYSLHEFGVNHYSVRQIVHVTLYNDLTFSPFPYAIIAI